MALSLTRGDLVTYARDNHFSQIDSTATRLFQRAVEHGLKLVSRERYWSFMQDDTQIITIVPVTGSGSPQSVTQAVASTTADFTLLTALPTNITGGAYTTFLEVNGEANWREIVTRTDDDTLVCRFAYAGSATVTGGSFVIAYPAYDLPLNFRRTRKLIDLQSRDTLRYIESDTMQWEHNEQAGTGTPCSFSVRQRRNDPTVYQLWLWPAPDTTVKSYQLLYWKDAGWYDTATPATNAWKREATADTDYVDWPPRMLDLLRQAILVSLYRENAPQKFGMAFETYMQMLSTAMQDDEVHGEVRTLSSGQRMSAPEWVLEP
ncbi:MAG: hypothetical protein IPP14_15695 [Planctomycetes bacterium]|nr:hypothetical protein [Planctomycetota bacterium]